MGLSNNPYGHELGANESIIGFGHTHPSRNSSTFGPDDLSVISNFSLGNYGWTNVPKIANFAIQLGWGVDKIKSVQVLHNNPRTIDRMYFGVIYSSGYDSFSWKYTDSKYLSTMYSNIWIMGGRDSNFLKYPTRFGTEYHTRRK